MTDKHLYSYCLKFYQNNSTIHYIEPNSTLSIDLISNTWYDTLTDERAAHFRKLGVKIGKDNRVRDYGKTKVKYVENSDTFANNYFLNFPNQINKIEKSIDTYSSKNKDLAIVNIENTKKHLITDLNNNRDKLSENLYEYLKGEIKYGAKKTF